MEKSEWDKTGKKCKGFDKIDRKKGYKNHDRAKIEREREISIVRTERDREIGRDRETDRLTVG